MSQGQPGRQRLIDFLAGSKVVQAAVQDEFPSVDQDTLASILGASSPTPVEPIQPRPQTRAVPSGLVFLHTDGACRGNPGPSSAGWVFSEPGGGIFRRGGAFLGKATNNEAEYVAVILALEDALKIGVSEVKLHADSELLVKQVNGIYRVKNPRIKELYTQLMALARKFKSFEAKHVRREFNQEADAEANRALDEAK
jgi:ribonuclease HI